MMLRNLNQGVLGVPSKETRTSVRKNRNTLMCSIRCSKGVPSKTVIDPSRPLEQLERKWNTSMCSIGCSTKRPISAGFNRVWNTWNTWNTVIREPQVKRHGLA